MKTTTILLIMILLFHSLPVLTTIAKNDELSLHSESAILMDAKTGLVLYEKNSKRKMYPASITKLVSGIVAIEEGNLADEVVVSENARNVEGTRVYLNEGEVVSLQKLLQGLLINSGNDAGIAIAEHMDGSVESFSNRMNTFVQEKIGVTDSSFVNPHGLFDENHYTTAYDMAQIMRYAIRNEEFKEIISTETLPWKGQSWETVLINHHRMMREIPYEGVVGGKNGYVQKSGFTLVTVAQRGERQFIAVTLKATGRNQPYQDTMTLFDYGFKHYDTSFIPEYLYINQEQLKSSIPEKVEKEINTLKLEGIKSENVITETGENKSSDQEAWGWSILLITLSFFGVFFLIVGFLKKKRSQVYL
jgi:D-alanyl-D-alanine carboxypeptidase